MKNIIKNTNKKGFTIVELVIVIAVIAILAGVLIPTFSSIITKANESAALQEAQAVYKEIYAVDLSDGTLDGVINGKDTLAAGLSAAGVANATKVEGYVVTEGEVTSFSYNTGDYTVTYDGTTWTVD